MADVCMDADHEVAAKSRAFMPLMNSASTGNYILPSKDKVPNIKPSSNSKPIIQKVTFLLRNTENVSKIFEPKVISVGPIHHGEKSEFQEAEMYKDHWKKMFTENSGKDETMLYNEIIKEIIQFRNCYDDEIVKKYNDDELARIFVKDGCAILHYIYCKVKNDIKGLNITFNQAVFVEQDMFLLENQLPFHVLDILTDHKKIWMDRIKMFVRKVSLASYLKQEGVNRGKKSSQVKSVRDIEANNPYKDEKPAHLLALLRESLFTPATDTGQQEQENGKRQLQPKDTEQQGQENDWESYRRVIELKESGINFKANKSMFLNDIDFTQHYISGTLKIPPIEIDDSTRCIFMNLIAYEMCPDYNNDLRVSSYIWFLDTLIDNPEDVQELRKAHILRNFLGCDEELSQLFNNIARDVVPNDKMFKLVRLRIQKHYDSKWRTNLATFCNTHFTTPWTAIAFFATLIVFVITGIQTYCSVYSCPAK